MCLVLRDLSQPQHFQDFGIPPFLPQSLRAQRFFWDFFLRFLFFFLGPNSLGKMGNSGGSVGVNTAQGKADLQPLRAEGGSFLSLI